MSKFIEPIYLAYGSNLNKSQMQHRCPTAVAIGSTTLGNWRLVFRGVADIEPAKDFRVQVGLWNITRKDELALDRYEGVGSGLYRKHYFNANGKVYLTYLMNQDGYSKPHKSYYEGLVQGYEDFNLDQNELDIAVAHAFRSGVGYGHVPKRLRG